VGDWGGCLRAACDVVCGVAGGCVVCQFRMRDATTPGAPLGGRWSRERERERFAWGIGGGCTRLVACFVVWRGGAWYVNFLKYVRCGDRGGATTIVPRGASAPGGRVVVAGGCMWSGCD
jgi:hypothetical protein